jgi:hypothetical protein
VARFGRGRRCVYRVHGEHIGGQERGAVRANARGSQCFPDACAALEHFTAFCARGLQFIDIVRVNAGVRVVENAVVASIIGDITRLLAAIYASRPAIASDRWAPHQAVFF